MTTATMNAQAQSGAKGLDAGKNAEAKVNWKCPTQSNVITSPFGPRNVKGGSNPHKGIDLRAQAGASYYAAADGKVTRAGGGDYNTIVIDHGGGIQTRYLHASSVSAKVGNVKAGDRLAAAGGKGPKGVNHYAYHLHFDVIKNGTYIDPEAFLQSQGVSLARKGGEGKTENGTTGGKKNNNAAQGGRQMNAEGHPIYYPKGAKETQDIINWNKGRNYTADYIKSFQKVIGTKVDGGIGTDTVNAIRHYQEKNGLGQDGKWGKDCADHAKLERKYNSGSAGNTTNQKVKGGTIRESKYLNGITARNNELWRLAPKVREAVPELITNLEKIGMKFKLFEGARTPARSNAIKTSGQTAVVASGWNSFHNYGMAVDMVLDHKGVNPWETKGKIKDLNGNDVNAAEYWKNLKSEGAKLGLNTISSEQCHLQAAPSTSVGKTYAYPHYVNAPADKDPLDHVWEQLGLN